jgi:polysaccharide export outer membrane protein
MLEVVKGDITRFLADAIVNRLRPDYLVNPRVTVELLGYRPFYILGEVRKPGDYPYVEGMTVLNAVALAGGFAPHAKRDKVVIERGSGTARKKLKARVGVRVQPGDIITVKERFF